MLLGDARRVESRQLNAVEMSPRVTECHGAAPSLVQSRLADAVGADPVALELGTALERWCIAPDPRELRRALLRLLAGHHLDV